MIEALWCARVPCFCACVLLSHHSRLRRKAGQDHLQFPEMFKLLFRECERSSAVVLNAGRGVNHNRREQWKYTLNNMQIFTLWHEFSEGKRDLMSLLRALSHRTPKFYSTEEESETE